MLDMDLRYDTAYDTGQGHEVLRAFMPQPPPRAGDTGNVSENSNQNSTGFMLDEMERAQAALDAACQSLGVNITNDTPTSKKTTTNTNDSVANDAALASPSSSKPIKRPPTTPYIHTSPIPHTYPLTTVEEATSSSVSGSTNSNNAQLLADESHSRGYLLRLQGQYPR